MITVHAKEYTNRLTGVSYFSVRVFFGDDTYYISIQRGHGDDYIESVRRAGFGGKIVSWCKERGCSKREVIRWANDHRK